MAAPQLDTDRCLRLRSRYSDCENCAQACPVHALRVSFERIELPDDCLGCGQCTAACPTGALHTDDFVASPAGTSSGPLYVDCWKVPPARSANEAMRVPCLGGIPVHELVRLHTVCAPHPVVLVDRGWCGQCSAGSKGNHPAQAALNATRELLAELGVAEPMLPRLERDSLSRREMPAEIPEGFVARRLSRRDFFTGIARDAARVIAPAAQPHEAQSETRRPLPRQIENPPRARLLEHAAVLRRRHRRPLPATLFPAVRLLDACRNHNVCAAVCPTGALRSYASEDGGARGIGFDAEVCIACGDCTRACPEQAIELLVAGNGKLPHGVATLTRWPVRECRDCGCAFANGGADTVCPACRKTRDLVRASFSQFFSAYRGTQEESTQVAASDQL